MKKRKLRVLEVSEIGFGCMGMSFGYGKAGDKTQMIHLMHEAIDLGVNFFDTAEAYGHYSNEELVGEGLSQNNARQKVILATKFGFDLQKGEGLNSEPKHIKQALEGSLKRLETDYVDLYYQHRIDSKVPIEEVAGAVGELIQEGKVRAFGISEVQVQFVQRAHKICPVSCLAK